MPALGLAACGPTAHPHLGARLPAPRPQLLRLDRPAPPGAWAIDLGASPGAWTQHLAGALGFNVAAVDPGALAPEVLALPGVRHFAARAEDVVADVAALVMGGAGGGGAGGGAAATGNSGKSGSGGWGGGTGGGAELLVSDVNIYPKGAIKVGVGWGPSGGVGVLGRGKV
jgi:hypothetical protein